MHPKTSADLQWARIVEAVGARCRGPLSARVVVPMASSAAGARHSLAETAEILGVLDGGEVVPLEGHRELGPLLLRVERAASLDAPELRDVMLVLQAARSLRLFLAARKERMPTLHQACALDPSLDVLRDELGSAIENDGTLSDHASAELRRLRTETANLRARIVQRLDQMLHEHSAILQDSFHTQREGRYVLPVRRDAHEKLKGIVHGTSASGATVFVEPRALVGQGNRLKMAQAEMVREEARILAELSELVRERLASLRAAIDALDHADLRQATARLGLDLRGTIVTVPDEPRIQLHAARHPVLLLEGIDVIPGDLELAAGEGLVLSGPNAGGKTVALKMLGLAALFVRAGIPVPADEGSQCGFFDPVLSDVGDDQSLQQSLSTFSAHVTHIARIVSASGPGSLILLDELAGGTDPVEGAALAAAILAALLDRGAAVATTTHYAPVKAFAATDPRLRNVAVGFDVANMAPTFELHEGVPGVSSALAVARRFGIDDSILADAEARLPDRGHAFEELLEALQRERDALAKRADGVAKQEASAEAALAAAEKVRQQALAERKQVLDDEARQLRAELRSARKALKTARATLRSRSEEETVAALREELDRASAVEAKGPRPTMVAPDDDGRPAVSGLEVGQRVYVPHMRSEAKVLELSEEKGVAKARVIAGALKLWVDIAKLRRADASDANGRASSAMGDASGGGDVQAAPAPHPVKTSDNTLDVRGMRVDDALTMTVSFLDRMYGASEPAAYILHGVGTGALRDAIRAQLGDDEQYVASYRGGSREEGGDRLTVVTLR